jgi:uncharacterized RDD family membrane protein YckC
MTSPPGPQVPWEAPEPVRGPAPGIEYGGYGERIVAYIVDGLILSAIMIALSIPAIAMFSPAIFDATFEPDVEAFAAFGFYIVAAIVVSILYFPWFWARGGQTPGMRLFDLRVVRDVDGGPVGWGIALLRLVGMWIATAVFYIGFIWVFVDPRRRGWHDLIAGTLVIKAPRS